MGFQRGAGRASGDLKVQRILKHLTEPTGERQHPFGTRLCLQSLVCYTLVPADAEKGLREAPASTCSAAEGCADGHGLHEGLVSEEVWQAAQVKMKANAQKDCRLGAHIAPEGFSPWQSRTDSDLASFAEAGSTGEGAAARGAWVKQLDSQQAEELLRCARKLCRPE